MKNKPDQFYYKNNRLQKLRGFCYAAQFGNMSQAARQMGVSHTSISLQIKALEQDMGVALFEREGPKIRLTDDGEKLLEMSLPLIDSIQNLRDHFYQFKRDEKLSELRIAVNAATKNYLLPSILGDYIKLHPEIHIILDYMELEPAIDKLHSGKVDIAVMGRHEHIQFPKSCEYTPIFFSKVCLITQPGHPLAGRKKLTVSEIKRHSLALPEKDLQVIPNLREMFGKEVDRLAPISFLNSETLREYIQAGLVITIAPDVWVTPHDDDLVATSLQHLFPDVDYGVVRLRTKQISKPHQDLINVMREHAMRKLGR